MMETEKNEQIEEMADVIKMGLMFSAPPKIIAECLYEEQGYRKLERGEWAGNAYFGHCSECGMVVN